MIARHGTRALAAALVLGLGLGGCVTLLPTSQPVQLYRFDVQTAETPPAGGADAGAFEVYRATTGFAHGADGDQLLTATGDQVAYIAGARWIAPASQLFDEAESHAFDRSGGPARLARRGEVGHAKVGLRLDVESFEVRYVDGPGAAPTVVVQVRASLDRVADRQVIASQMFESRKKATGNTVSAIVPEFDAALTDVLGQVVAWTNAKGAG